MAKVKKSGINSSSTSGLGMVGGAAAGAAAGSMVGPIGAAVGAVVGGVAGANAKRIAQQMPASVWQPAKKSSAKGEKAAAGLRLRTGKSSAKKSSAKTVKKSVAKRK
jgi:phage tail tape-measure protein